MLLFIDTSDRHACYYMKYEQGPPIYPAKPTGSILARVIGDGRVFYGVFDSRLVEPHGWAMTSPQLVLALVG